MTTPSPLSSKRIASGDGMGRRWDRRGRVRVAPRVAPTVIEREDCRSRAWRGRSPASGHSPEVDREVEEGAEGEGGGTGALAVVCRVYRVHRHTALVEPTEGIVAVAIGVGAAVRPARISCYPAPGASTGRLPEGSLQPGQTGPEEAPSRRRGSKAAALVGLGAVALVYHTVDIAEDHAKLVAPSTVGGAGSRRVAYQMPPRNSAALMSMSVPTRGQVKRLHHLAVDHYPWSHCFRTYSFG